MEGNSSIGGSIITRDSQFLRKNALQSKAETQVDAVSDEDEIRRATDKLRIRCREWGGTFASMSEEDARAVVLVLRNLVPRSVGVMD